MKVIALGSGPNLSRESVLVPSLSLENVLSPCEAQPTVAESIQTLKRSLFSTEAYVSRESIS